MTASGTTKQELPEELKTMKTDEWMETINSIYSKLQDDKVANLLLLADDPTAADRISQNINKHKVLFHVMILINVHLRSCRTDENVKANRLFEKEQN